MADMDRVFETDEEFLAYWTDLSRVEFVGSYDWMDAKRAFGNAQADLLVPNGGSWLAYKVKDAYMRDRPSVIAFTKRMRKVLLDRSMA